MATLKTRMAYEVRMDIETLHKMIVAAQNAQEAMTEGQVFRLEVSHNFDFVFHGLKPFNHGTAITRESQPPTD